jgi:hypothetical protein
VTYEREQTEDPWESVWGPGPADLGETAPDLEPQPVRTLRGLIRADPISAATWLIVPVVAWVALGERFSGITALVLGTLTGTAVGFAVLFSMAKGWLEADD